MSAKKFHETAEFKRLNKEWSKKLADSGFDDIEKNEDEYVVRPQEFTLPANIKPDSMEYNEFVELAGGLDHYEYCQAILRDFDFKRPVDKAIFEMYAEGVTERDIRDELPRLGYKALTQQAINLVINRVKERYQRG